MLAGMARFYVDGGFWMHPIAIAGVIAFAIALERGFMLMFRFNINAAQFMAQVQKLVMANNVDRAIKLCNAAPSAALPKVIKAALTRANKGELEINQAVEETTLEVVPEITKRTSTMSQVANIATLLGLLGTIVGLIDAFDAVATAPPDMKTTMLTKSISIAMNTTAFGLIVAIPTIALSVYLGGITKKIIDEIDHYSVKLQNLLIARGKAGASGGPGQAGGQDANGGAPIGQMPPMAAPMGAMAGMGGMPRPMVPMGMPVKQG